MEQTIYQDGKILVTTQRLQFGNTTIPIHQIAGVNSTKRLGLIGGVRSITVLSGGRSIEVFRSDALGLGNKKAEQIEAAINQALFSQTRR